MSPTLSQQYLSTRGAEYGRTFEDVVLQGLASDGGLFIPEKIPSLPESWETEWCDLSFEDLALEIMSLYISTDEIPREDLKNIINKSYSTFRHPERTPSVLLEKNLYLLELFHGPTFAFKDVALSFLGNLFEYFLVRKNAGKTGKDRHHLTVVGATSGDTGSAAIYGLRGKKDVSVFILFPDGGRVSPIQEKQMTTILDPNVHNLTVAGSFDHCQDIVKALFADEDLNSTHNIAAVNSINMARILAQITYFFYSYFSLTKTASFNKDSKVRVVVPSGNFGDILAGWFAKQMGLPIDKLVIATNANDILDRFFRSEGHYTKKALDSPTDHGVKETHSPAMDILVSSNFERLLWFLSYQTANGTEAERRKHACEDVSGWLNELKTNGGFQVPSAVLEAAKVDFERSWSGSAKSSKTGGYILDPHTAVGVAATRRSLARNPDATHISLSTAHPAKFASAVDLALRSEDGYDFTEILPQEFVGLEQRESRVTPVGESAGWQGVKEIVKAELEQELQGLR
ncbi:Tryptophan synthase beta subunit-like PLP-dependent enzymes superfamily [Penicillium expansum]|nr:Tryptophan synthase beta subunit-like PLP-dependent enzymes superfamily [Penicillium expansum]